MTSENRRAQDEAETDDHFYLDPSNPTAADDAFQQYRHGFYRLFAYRQLKKQQTSKTKKKGKKFTMPEAKPPQDIYEVDEFVNYLTNVKWDMRLSYTYAMHFFHIYLIYAYTTRLLKCPTAESKSSSWLWWWYPSSYAWTCNLRPRTYVDFIGFLQLSYYALIYFGRLRWHVLERFVLVHFTYLINGCLWNAWWFLPQTSKNGLKRWLLSGSSSETGTFGTWRALWLPLAYWSIFLLARRTTVGLLMWERDNTLDMEDEEDRKVKRRKRISSVSLWRLWSYFSAVLPLAVWELLLKPKASPTDLVQWPGLFRIVVISLASGFGMRTWLKLLHFEVQALVWTDPWQHGLVFYDVGGGMLIGMLFP